MLPGLRRQSQTSTSGETLDANMEEGHLQGLSFNHGINSL